MLAKRAATATAFTRTTNRMMASATGAPVIPLNPVRKLVIVGSGPAGHSAAIYAARANLQPLMYEGFIANGIAAGGQLTTTTDLENYLGFPDGINGLEFTELMAKQSARFGTEIQSKTVTKVDLSTRPFKLWLEGEEQGEPTLAQSLIIATGAVSKKLTVPGADTYWQKGVSTCATCDGYFFRKKVVAVVGGGDSAAEEALYLSKLCSSVLLVHRRDKLRASKIMSDRVAANPKIVPVWNSVIEEVLGNGRVQSGLKLRNLVTGDVTEVEAAGLFLAIGHVPATSFLDGQLELDEEAYIKTGADMAASVEGVWAAGDVQDKKYRQAIVAAGYGCVAALEAERWLTVHAPEAALPAGPLN